MYLLVSAQISIPHVLFEAKPMNITELVRGLSEDEVTQGLGVARSMKNEKNIKIKYDEYVSTYKRLHNDDNYEKVMTYSNGKLIAAGGWSNKQLQFLRNLHKQKKKNLFDNISKFENDIILLKELYQNSSNEEKLINKETRRQLKAELIELKKTF